MIDEVFVQVDGLNLFRIAQKLIDGGVMLSNLTVKKSSMIFSLSKKDLDKLSRICKRERKSFYVVKNSKIKRFFAKMPYCLGGFLSFVLLFAFFYAVYGTVFSVNVTCKTLNDFDLKPVNDLLLKNNISIGARKIDLKTSEIEKLILENLTDVAGCRAYYDGLNLNIEVFPAATGDNLTNKDLVSNYNAIVTKINLFAGDCKIKKGDLVQEGDVLIKNNNGAKAEIFGKVYFSSTMIFNEKQYVVEETGNVFETYSYGFGDVFIYKNAENCTFQNYNLEETKEVLIKNLFIPVICKKYVYKEVVIKEKIIKFESVEENLKEKLKKETLEKLPEGAIAGKVTYSIVKENNYVRIDCFIETEISLL